MAITTVPENKPGNPSDPSEVSENTLGNPTELTEVSENGVLAPSDMTEVAESTVGNPSDMTEVAESTVGNPSDMTEVAISEPAAPTDLTEVAESTVGNPTGLTLTEAGVIPRQLEPRINLNFASNGYAQLGAAKSLTDIVTYSRASSATYFERYVSQFGDYRYRLATDYVGDVENLVTYSEQFNNPDWTKTRVTITSNKERNPINGERNADLITDNTDNNTHFISATTSTVTSGAQVNPSFYAKAGSLSKIGVFELASNQGVMFDLTSGVSTADFGSYAGEFKAEYIKDGWYRLSFAPTVPSTAATLRIYLEDFAGYQGTGEGSIYIWGAQLTESAKPLPYVKTLGSAVTETFTASPRLAYDPATGESLGYLVEGSSSNLNTYSEQFEDSSYIKTRLTIDENSTLAPDGTKSADGLISSADNNTHQIDKDITVTNNATVTLSIFAKSGAQSWIRVYDSDTAFGAFFDLANGEVGTESSATAKIENKGGGWYRCSVTVTASGTNCGTRIRTATADNNDSFAGDGSSISAYICGFQLEEQPAATSYIRTEGATVSRSEDQMTIPASILPNKGTVSSTQKFIGDTGSNQFVIYEAGESGVLQFAVATGFASALFRWGSPSSTYSQAVPENQFFTSTITQNGSSAILYTSFGMAESEALTGQFQTNYSGDIEVGQASGGSEMFGYIKQIKIYDKALTAQEVALL